MPTVVIPAQAPAAQVIVDYPCVVLCTGLTGTETVTIEITSGGGVYAALLDDFGAPVTLNSTRNAISLPFATTYNLSKSATAIATSVSVSTVTVP